MNGDEGRIGNLGGKGELGERAVLEIELDW